METSSPIVSACHCDPLKLILQWFLTEILPGNGILSESVIANIHLLYKSSILRCKLGKSEPELKITQETIKAVKQWAEDVRGGWASRELVQQDFEEYLESVIAKFGSFHGKSGRNYAVNAVLAENGGYNLRMGLHTMKEETIRWMLMKGTSNFGECGCHNKLYNVQIGMTSSPAQNMQSTLLEYRKALTARAISNVVKKVGHQVDSNSFISIPLDKRIHRTIFIAATQIEEGVNNLESKVLEKDTGSVPEIVICVSVGDFTAVREPAAKISLSELLSERLNSIQEVSESRRSDTLVPSMWETSVCNLAITTLHYDLLNKPTDIDVQLSSILNRQMNHDALFIMYNYSRLLSILRRFNEQVKSSEYPSLSNLNEVDFRSICQYEQELQLLRLVMEWPRILEGGINFLRHELTVSLIPKFLLALAKAFNSFYFEVVVLVPSTAPHNFHTMMARIYFMKAICTVFEDCLDIMQVNHSGNAMNSSLKPCDG